MAQNFNKECDVWACGIVIFMLLYGYPPFDGQTDEETYTQIRQGFQSITRPGIGPWFNADIEVSSEAKDLVSQMLAYSVDDRIDIEECLAHPWLLELGLESGSESVQPLNPCLLDRLKKFRSKSDFRTRVCRRVSQVQFHFFLSHVYIIVCQSLSFSL